MKETMLKEWSNADVSYVLLAIKDWMQRRKFETMHHGEIKRTSSIKAIENMLGLVYTNTGRCAELSICNTELYLDEEHKFKVCSFMTNEKDTVYY